MIKVLIVEDELLTRIGIESMVPWEQYGFTVVGIAENGQQGLNMAINRQPDIIITDVMMPILNGIELMKAVGNSGLKSKFIILSAYNEFAYVKEALKLGALDYILKLDIEPAVLLEALEKAKKVLPKLTGTKTTVTSWKDKATCIQQILKGKDPKRALQSCDLEIPEKNLLCIYSHDMLCPNDLLQVGFYPNIKTIVCTLNELLTHFGVAYGCSIQNQHFFHILSAHTAYSQMELVERTYEIQNVIHDYFLKSFNISLSVQASKMVQNFRELTNEFNTMITDPSEEEESTTKILTDINRLKDSLESQSPEETGQFFSTLISTLQKQHIQSTDQLYSICFSLVSSIDSFLSKNPLIKTDWDISSEINFISQRCTNADQYMIYIKLIKERTLRTLFSSEQSNQLVLKVKNYIESHYEREDITLEKIGDSVHASPNYLCRI
jgi:two-component system, response regulator YesN